MNYYGLIGLFNGAVVLSVGFYLFTSRKQNSLYKSFAAVSFSAGFWSIFYALWQVQTTKDLALLCIRLAMLFCYFIPFSFLWFVCNLTGVQLKKWQASFLWVFPTCLAVFAFSPWAVKSVEPRLSFPFWPVPGIVAHIYFISLFVMALLAFTRLFYSYRKAEGFQKWQNKWMFLIFFLIWLGGCTNIPLWYNIPVYPAPNIFVGVGFLILFFAVLRARLFDVDALADYVQEAKLSALGIMATSINHEVRNPLFVIRGMAETQLERLRGNIYADKAQLEEKSKEMLQKTIQQADRALEIIHNFSAYAKRQSSKTFDKQSLDIKEVLESIVPLVCSELALDHIRLQMNIPSKTMVCADRQSLEEIFLNLIVNGCQAIKSMERPGEIRIRAEIAAPLKAGLAMTSAQSVIITIQDTGPGIPPEQLRRIFEPFYTTKATGTGLGLYIVKQLVEKNSGRVEVCSQEGRGTIFTVSLPR